MFQSEEGWEEFYDYIFPEDEAEKPNLKLLASAKAWKKKMEEMQETVETEDNAQKSGDQNVENSENPDADSPVESSSEEESGDED